MPNSRNKGAAGEREAAKKIKEVLGVEARRGQQFSGGADSPDVVTGIPGVHIEVKRVERLNLGAAMDQSRRDAGDKIPVVMHRKNRGRWLLTVDFDRLPELARILADLQE